jgi:esterase/lipase superfamily enzyme
MYFVTNRKLYSKRPGLKLFGDTPNPRGANELRLVKVEGKNSTSYRAQVLMDKLGKAEVEQLAADYQLPIDTSGDWYASLKVACALYKQACDERKSILFFVHGYNNDVEDVYKTALELEKRQRGTVWLQEVMLALSKLKRSTVFLVTVFAL